MEKIAFFDSEWTSNGSISSRREYQELIQVALIVCDKYKLNKGNKSEIITYTRFVKPVASPILTDYIKNLTGITQKDIDKKGITVEKAVIELNKIIEENKITKIYVWGQDKHLLIAQLKNHKELTNRQKQTLINRIEDVSVVISKSIMEEVTLSQSDVNYIYGNLQKNEHTALDDARTLKNIYAKKDKINVNDKSFIEKVEKYKLYMEEKKEFLRLRNAIYDMLDKKRDLNQIIKKIFESYETHDSKFISFNDWDNKNK